MAGVNAALYVRGEEPLMLRRDQSYVGVMVDDLITKEHSEPYRLFTSRAEFRLLLRGDNADLRLGPIGYRLGLQSEEFIRRVKAKRSAVRAELERLAVAVVASSPEAQTALARRGLTLSTQGVSALQLLRRSGVDYSLIEELCPPSRPLSGEARETVEIEAKYAGYIERQRAEVERLSRLERRPLPRGLRYEEIVGLRAEAAERLAQAQPLTVGQAARLAGVNPVDVAVLLAHLERKPGLESAEHEVAGW